MGIDYWQTLHENAYYHIYNRTNGAAFLFTNHENYQFFLKKWHLYLNNYIDTMAYCLMSNHFHFIVKVKAVDNTFKIAVQNENTVASNAFLLNKINLDAFLEDQFKRFFTSYAKAFNKQQNRNDSLFQPSFKRIQLKNREHLLDKIAYVHHNPIHHDLNPFYDSWIFSSYSAYLSDKPTHIKRQEGLKLFSPNGDLNSFISFHQEFHIKWVLSHGSTQFDDRMEP